MNPVTLPQQQSTRQQLLAEYLRLVREYCRALRDGTFSEEPELKIQWENQLRRLETRLGS